MWIAEPQKDVWRVSKEDADEAHSAAPERVLGCDRGKNAGKEGRSGSQV